MYTCIISPIIILFFIFAIGIYKVTKDENLWKKIYHVKFRDLLFEDINYIDFNGNITHCPNCYIQEDNLKMFRFCQSEYLNHTWLALFQVCLWMRMLVCTCMYICTYIVMYMYIYVCIYVQI
jgi:hypothetical protein